jgi:ABC-2 type transport system ATP-binding protein
MLELRDLRKTFRRAAASAGAGSKRKGRGQAAPTTEHEPEMMVALDGLSLSVAPGRIVGFVGANGAGKTTAMRIALGVLAPDSGEVLVDGRPATSDDRRRFGYMPEERGLYPKMRVGDQIAYLARLHGYSAVEAEASTGRWLDRLGVAARRDDRVESLSLGNQQRVQLAAALVHHPRFLVLDEPFSGLDPIGVDVMSDVLRSAVAEGAGVVFSSHQLELVERLCDEVVIIRSGQVVAAGTVAELGGSRRRRRLSMLTSADPRVWLPSSYSVVDSSVDEGRWRSVVELPDGVDAAAATRAAAEAGDLLEATPIETSLTDIFREVVAR